MLKLIRYPLYMLPLLSAMGFTPLNFNTAVVNTNNPTISNKGFSIPAITSFDKSGKFGCEKRFNDKATERAIVIRGADYVSSGLCMPTVFPAEAKIVLHYLPILRNY